MHDSASTMLHEPTRQKSFSHTTSGFSAKAAMRMAVNQALRVRALSGRVDRASVLPLHMQHFNFHLYLPVVHRNSDKIYDEMFSTSARGKTYSLVGLT